MNGLVINNYAKPFCLFSIFNVKSNEKSKANANEFKYNCRTFYNYLAFIITVIYHD